MSTLHQHMSFNSSGFPYLDWGLSLPQDFLVPWFSNITVFWFLGFPISEVLFWFYLFIFWLFCSAFSPLFVDFLKDSVLHFLLFDSCSLFWKCIQSHGLTVISMGMTSNSGLSIFIQIVVPWCYLPSKYFCLYRCLLSS